MLKIRASALGQVMGDAKSIDPDLLDTPELKVIAAKKTKTDADKAILAPLHRRSLSAGAKTFVKNAVRRAVFDYHPEMSCKYTEKGHAVEQDSIDLYNFVHFTTHQKNEERRENDWIGGTCDIDAGDMIIDIKSSWSLESFPIFAEDAHDAGYEWQVRGYMMLWDRPRAEVAFCMVDTPDYLCSYEPECVHIVGHIDPFQRVTIVRYERDMEKEQAIIDRVSACQAYYNKLLSSLKGA